MALLLPRSIYFHIPKTAGNWVVKAIGNAGIVARKIGDPKLMAHDLPWQFPDDGRTRFAFVRHPVNWYASFWGYRMGEGWRKDTLLDIKCKSMNFNDFMEKVFKYCPSHVSQMYELWFGSPKHPTIRVYGKQENLVDDLVKILKNCGEIFNEDLLRETPPENVSEEKPEISDELKKRIIASEKRAIERFNYEP